MTYFIPGHCLQSTIRVRSTVVLSFFNRLKQAQKNERTTVLLSLMVLCRQWFYWGDSDSLPPDVSSIIQVVCHHLPHPVPSAHQGLYQSCPRTRPPEIPRCHHHPVLTPSRERTCSSPWKDGRMFFLGEDGCIRHARPPIRHPCPIHRSRLRNRDRTNRDRWTLVA